MGRGALLVRLVSRLAPQLTASHPARSGSVWLLGYGFSVYPAGMEDDDLRVYSYIRTSHRPAIARSVGSVAALGYHLGMLHTESSPSITPFRLCLPMPPAPGPQGIFRDQEPELSPADIAVTGQPGNWWGEGGAARRQNNCKRGQEKRQLQEVCVSFPFVHGCALPPTVNGLSPNSLASHRQPRTKPNQGISHAFS